MEASIASNAGRRLSAATILFHQAAAERLGLNVTDHKCMDIILRASGEGPVTAGKLAQLSGLTTGAVTGVIDRLEDAGFVRRAKHPEDRRAVVIEPIPEKVAEADKVFEPLFRAWAKITPQYSEKELRLILRFMDQAADVMEQQARALRGK